MRIQLLSNGDGIWKQLFLVYLKIFYHPPANQHIPWRLMVRRWTSLFNMVPSQGTFVHFRRGIYKHIPRTLARPFFGVRADPGGLAAVYGVTKGQPLCISKKYLEQMKKNRWFRVCKGWNPTPIVWGLFRKPFTRIPELNQPGFHGKKSEVLFRGFSGASKVCPKFDQPKTDQCCRFFSKPSWRSWYIYIIIPRTQLTSNFCR